MADFLKDPAALLDYTFDWSAWLNGDSITGATASVEPNGLTLEGVTYDPTTVTVWLSGGTEGQTYTVGCQINTSGGRADHRSMTVEVKRR